MITDGLLYQDDEKIVTMEGKTVKIINHTPMLEEPMNTEERKRIEKALYYIFKKYQ